MQSTDQAPTPMNPNEWCWLQPGVDGASVLAMFHAVYLMAMTLAWHTLTGREAARAYFASRDETLHLRLETRFVRPGRLRIMLHIARDDETLAAWREGLIGATQITIAAVPRQELPTAGIVEWCRLGREPYDELPLVTVGLEQRRPSAEDWHLAARAIEAFDVLHDCISRCYGPGRGARVAPLERDTCEDGLERLELASGEPVFIETLPPEFDAFPANDGGIVIRHLDSRGEVAAPLASSDHAAM